MDFTVDASGFNAACEELIQLSDKTYPEFVNGRMFAVAIKAKNLTKFADRSAIQNQMGGFIVEGGTFKRGARAGQKRKDRQFYDLSKGSSASRIVNWRRMQQGKKCIWGQKLRDASQRMISSRLQSIGFIKSGWIYAIRELQKVVYGVKAASDGFRIKLKGAPKGGANPARFAVNSLVSSEIFNTSLIAGSKYGSNSDPMSIAKPALEQALADEQAEMQKHYVEKFQPLANKFNSK